MELERSIKALKADDFAVGQLICADAKILGVESLETEFGLRNQITLDDSKTKMKVFLNRFSQDALIDAYGTKTENWINKYALIRCERAGGKFKNKMIVVLPMASVQKI